MNEETRDTIWGDTWLLSTEGFDKQAVVGGGCLLPPIFLDFPPARDHQMFAVTSIAADVISGENNANSMLRGKTLATDVNNECAGFP